MTPPDRSPETETEQVSKATAYLAERNISATAKEFRLRQEFHRFGWDIRVRDSDGGSIVHSLKPERPEVLVEASTEGNALRIALMQSMQADEASQQ